MTKKVPGDPERTEIAKNPTYFLPKRSGDFPLGVRMHSESNAPSKSSAFPLPRPAENATNLIASALT